MGDEDLEYVVNYTVGDAMCAPGPRPLPDHNANLLLIAAIRRLSAVDHAAVLATRQASLDAP
jgi:hypothetical protein